ncbi:MAG TPA: TetR/AcrR family transcriptional regulator [Conexibacter sp.]|nr:TetR/AcrR family transcriptional regulator [Conexibacter sp.]
MRVNVARSENPKVSRSGDRKRSPARDVTPRDVTPRDVTPRSLPRGRHAAAREVVLASQRGRLLEAMAACVADHGYAATTVAQVIARAGVSRKTFYEQFTDKRACFLAAWEVGTDILIEQVLASGAEADGWRARLRAGIDAFLDVLAAEPDFARSFMIEVLSVGEEALARRAEIHERFAAVLAGVHAQALAEGADLGRVPPWALRASSGAAWELTVEHLRTRGVEGLAELAPQIERVQLAILGGDYADSPRSRHT